MNEIIYAMVEYAERSRVPAYLAKNNRCQESQRASEQQTKLLRQMLPDEGRQKLEDLLGELQLIQEAKQEAMFVAGFSMGQEFSRL